ncbi:Putative membrane spanning protein (plasmid) [Borrelia hermsii YBT]|uniref:CRASP family complement regulator-acquiring lipoprotein n=1 Tax=Borrelia hermsii TaxID=140 RepID=UPI0003E3510B|nr:CRASP family complement regulator-acquiring lipoprotein [Borrelia hermsii]AHH13055.1 Putative membrane spanning protein [Borrelia hermsii YBT]
MKYKIFIICILTGLFLPLLALISCNSEPEKTEGVKLGAKLNANTLTPKPGPHKHDPLKSGGLTDGLLKPDNPPPNPNNPGRGAAGNSGSGAANQQDEAEKQVIVNHLITLIVPSIKDNINIYNSTTWNEVTQAYDISSANQLFDVIEYDNAQSQKTKYNGNDDESKTTRREMYLAFDYKKNYIKAFGALANKMAATKNVQMKTELENMVKKIREYGTAYHLTAFNTLINKKDKLLKLDLSDLQILKARFDAIHPTERTIFFKFKDTIYSDYELNIEVGTASPKKNQLQTTATAEEIQKYLKDKFTSVEPDFDKVIEEAPKIAGILNKIQ